MAFFDSIAAQIKAQDAATAAGTSAESGSKYKLTSLPSEIKFNKVNSVGPSLSEMTTWETNLNGTDYYYIPQDFLSQGVTGTGYYHGAPQTYYMPQALSNKFQNELKNNGTYVDLSNVNNAYGGTLGDYLAATGRSATGYLVPKNDITKNVVENWQITDLGPNGTSGIRGIINVPDDALGEKGLAYAMYNSKGYDLGYTDSTGHGYLYSFKKPSELQKFVSSLGPLPTLATAIFAPEFLPLVSGAQTAVQGGDLGDVLKSAGKSYVLSQIGQEVAGSPASDTSGLQNVYGGDLPIEDVQAAFDVPSPLADTTAALDTAFLQDTSQGIEPLNPVVPVENPYLAGMEDTTATEGAGVAGAENPTGTYEGGANYLSGMEETAANEGAGVSGTENPTGAVVTTPETPTETSSGLTPKQIYNLLKLGSGLFGGGGALAMAAKGLMGGSTGIPGTTATMPTVQAPTPFTGTYSGMNPYDAAYFQQVQQNYNRLFPTAPTDVGTPLQSWYQTQYKPDTTISNKLFGV